MSAYSVFLCCIILWFHLLSFVTVCPRLTSLHPYCWLSHWNIQAISPSLSILWSLGNWSGANKYHYSVLGGKSLQWVFLLRGMFVAITSKKTCQMTESPPRDVAIGIIFLSQTMIGILGNFSLLYQYLFIYHTGCRMRAMIWFANTRRYPPVKFGERTRDFSPGQAGKEGPNLSLTGASCGFSRTTAPVWVFSRGTMGYSGSLLCGTREVSFPACGKGSASLLWSHGRGTGCCATEAHVQDISYYQLALASLGRTSV